MRVLIQLAHEHLEFRLPEIKSIARIFGHDLNIPKDHSAENPFLVVDLPDEDAVKNIVKRSVLIKSSMEVWAQADNYPSFFEKLSLLNHSLFEKFLSSEKSFRVKVESFNKQLSISEKIEKIEQLTNGPLEFKGRVDLKDDCDVTFNLFEYYRRVGSGSEMSPSQIYFGRWICDGHRDEVKKYNLSQRKFIGNTSMDPTLSMIIANLAKIRPGSLVYDPFVGTGSLLVSSAHYGGYVMGSDLDYNVICGVGKSSRAGQKWKSKEETIRNNLKQYGLEDLYVDALVADASLHKMWRPRILFDAIVTDPPYGIREPTMKLGFRKTPSPDFEIPEELKENHIPCKKSYNLKELLCDLLRFAVRHLNVGGRLVFWMPVSRDGYSEENIPRHDCLELISNCEQILNNRVSRRLIIMEKFKELQKNEEGSQVTILKDHYEDVSFRDVYFRSSKTSKFSN